MTSEPQTTPPQLSPDGRWEWDGQQWVAAPAAPVASVPEWASPPAGPVTMTPAFASRPPAAKHDGLAIASLVLSLIWVMGLGSIAGVVLGHISRNNAEKEGRPKSGVALAGLIIGYVGCAFLTIGILAAIAIPVFLNQRVEVVKDELRSAALAEEAYATDNGSYVEVEALPPSLGYTPGNGVHVTLVSATETTFCLAGAKGALTYYYDSASGTVQEHPCG